MSLWVRLCAWFHRAPPPLLRDAPQLDDLFFSLDNGWWGLHASSPSGRWVVSWRDGHWVERTKGRRRFEPGAYLLYDTQAERITVEGRAPRPNNGAVANTGTFLLEEWGEPAVLSSRLLAFDLGGRALLDAALTANIAFSALSPHGRYAVAQMANSGTEDSGRLMLFDLATGRRIYSVMPEAGWPDRYEVNDATGEVTVHLRGLGGFAYGADGHFRDAEHLEQVKVRKGTARDVADVADAVLRGPTFRVERAEGAIRGLTRVLAQETWSDPREHARVLKRLGLLYEALNQFSLAITAFERACALDPKVGVKRRLAALRKR